MSDYSVCTQCGTEIEENGIQFLGHMFCSDECCEAYEQEFPENGDFDPDDEDLENFEDDLDYVEKEDFEGDGLDDDDYDIRPEDF
ncbi:hypothetical protein CSB20_07495 [bacterium DOLZORAL124_64_63]|nr:MAG: hypothetical protein CSB20_07495 [bacterium DOLZORAL124_64_63]